MEPGRSQRVLSRGTKDELEYYATQFNSIELNATFTVIFPSTLYEGGMKNPNRLPFFKNVPGVTHWKRLNDFEGYLNVNTCCIPLTSTTN